MQQREHFSEFIAKGRISPLVALFDPAPVIDFVLPGLPVGDVGLLVAPGATGKSFLALQIGAAVSAGLPFIEGADADGAWAAPKSTGRVLLLASEDPKPILQLRMRAFMSHLHNSGVSDAALEAVDQQLDVVSAKGNLDQLMLSDGSPGPLTVKLLDVAHEYRLIILDPLARLHAGDENDNAKMTRLISIAEHVAQRAGCAILLLHHTSKFAALSGQGNNQHASRGASGLVDGSRVVYAIQTMTDAEADEYGVEDVMRRHWVRLAMPKANYLAPQPDVWLRRQDGGVLVRGILERPERRKAKTGKAAEGAIDCVDYTDIFGG